MATALPAVAREQKDRGVLDDLGATCVHSAHHAMQPRHITGGTLRYCVGTMETA